MRREVGQAERGAGVNLGELFRRRRRTKPGTRVYNAHGLAGCVEQRRSRATGHLVTLYHSVQSGIEMDPETPWTLVCEEHSSCVCHSSLREARGWMAEPDQWCEPCREELAKRAASESTIRLK